MPSLYNEKTAYASEEEMFLSDVSKINGINLEPCKKRKERFFTASAVDVEEDHL